jgi:hypothetical protein
MLNHCNYNKVRLLHDLSRIVWFLKKHAKEDAKKEGHEACMKMCEDLEVDLEKHIDKIKNNIAGLAKEEKL